MSEPLRLKTKNYLNGPDFHNQIVLSQQQGVLTPEAVKMYMLLSDRVSWKFKYRDEADRKDCISASHLRFLRYWRSYDPIKTRNAFAYFTQVIKMSMAEEWGRLHDKNMKMVRLDDLFNI